MRVLRGGKCTYFELTDHARKRKEVGKTLARSQHLNE